MRTEYLGQYTRCSIT